MDRVMWMNNDHVGVKLWVPYLVMAGLRKLLIGHFHVGRACLDVVLNTVWWHKIQSIVINFPCGIIRVTTVIHDTETGPRLPFHSHRWLQTQSNTDIIYSSYVLVTLVTSLLVLVCTSLLVHMRCKACRIYTIFLERMWRKNKDVVQFQT